MGDEVGAEPPSLIGDKMAMSSHRRRMELRRLNSQTCSTSKRGKSHHDDSSGDSSSSPAAPTLSSSANDDGEAAVPAIFGNERPPLLSHGSVTLMGRRRDVEDAVRVAPGFAAAAESPTAGEGGDDEVPSTESPAYDFFGVYDGHGGSSVAEVCGERLHLVLAEEVAGGRAEGRWREAMVSSFARVDRELAGAGRWSSEKTVGSTAVVAVVGPTRIVVANCGDSRAVLSRGGVPVPLSSDHKADRRDEMERVEAAGGRVINWDGYRILGVLATSRSIGDYYLKPFVTSEPEITITERAERDEFLILASHGLWDVVSNDLACHIARQCLSGEMARMFRRANNERAAGDAAAMLAQLALSLGSNDNISVVVVEFRKIM